MLINNNILSKHKHTILMADVLESRDYPGNQLMKQLKKTVRFINKGMAGAILSPLTITLGDEFQAVVKSEQDGIRIILAIEEFRISQGFEFRLRYVLLYGTIDTPLNAEYAHEMLGEGLTRARELVEKVKTGKGRFLAELDSGKKTGYLNRLFFLYCNLIDEWKPNDYQLIDFFIRYRDYKLVADKTGRDLILPLNH